MSTNAEPGSHRAARNAAQANSAALLVDLDGVPALRVDPAGGRFAPVDAVRWLGAADALSCGWRPPIAVYELTNWLEHLLPENGRLLHARRRADAALREHGFRREASGPADILWGNFDIECPGAVGVGAEVAGAKLADANPGQTVELTPEAIATLVRWEAYQTTNDGPRPQRPEFISATSLSGMRPKLGLHCDPLTGAWHVAHSQQLSTHIVKLEDAPDLPGEAVAEAVSLRALAYAGVAAADTAVRVWGGRSCVLSRRSDRVVQDGKVVARHQEEWGQAACLGTHEKFAHQREEPGWADFHAMLAASSPSREASDAAFMRTLVGCALLAHTDLHRQNIGFLHTGFAADGPRCEIAPMYDVSCADGRPTTTPGRSQYRLAAQRRPCASTPRPWTIWPTGAASMAISLARWRRAWRRHCPARWNKQSGTARSWTNDGLGATHTGVSKRWPRAWSRVACVCGTTSTCAKDDASRHHPELTGELDIGGVEYRMESPYPDRDLTADRAAVNIPFTRLGWLVLHGALRDGPRLRNGTSPPPPPPRRARGSRLFA